MKGNFFTFKDIIQLFQHLDLDEDCCISQNQERTKIDLVKLNKLHFFHSLNYVIKTDTSNSFYFNTIGLILFLCMRTFA